MTDWRGRFPFPVGAPSWVLPLTDDNFVGNVTYLSDKVDRVQILCFEKDSVGELLTPRDLNRLREIGGSTGLGYSVHLPGDLALLDPEDTPAVRTGKLELLLHIAALTAELEPDHFVLHLDLPGGARADGGLVDRAEACLTQLVSLWPEAPGLVYVENTGWDLTQVAGPLERLGFGVCADFGHLYRGHLPLPAFLDRLGPLIREVHLHGFDELGDHLALARLPPSVQQPLRSLLVQRCPSVVIENFRADWLQDSLATLASWL